MFDFGAEVDLGVGYSLEVHDDTRLDGRKMKGEERDGVLCIVD